jgi:hypothetical protein
MRARRQPRTPRGRAPISRGTVSWLMATGRSGMGVATPRRSAVPRRTAVRPTALRRRRRGTEPGRRRTVRGMGAACSASAPQHVDSGCRRWNRGARRPAPRATPTSPARGRRLASPWRAPRARREGPPHHPGARPQGRRSFVRRACAQRGAGDAGREWGPLSISGPTATQRNRMGWPAQRTARPSPLSEASRGARVAVCLPLRSPLAA